MSKVYQIIADRILLEIEETNLLPWRKPWSGIDSLPTSGNTGKPYRGINMFLLSMMQKSQPLWFTYKQLRKMEIAKEDLATLKGKSVPVCYFNFIKDKKDPKKTFPMLRYFSVFNAEDIKGLPEKYIVKGKEFAHNPITAAEQVLATMEVTPVINHGSNKAYYTPETHTVTMPNKTAFETSDAYYTTLFHELIHWTSKALDRELGTSFGSDDYATEELIAEFGAAMLCGVCGIDNTLKNSASYIKGWSDKIKADPKVIVKAAGKAQKAVDYILGVKFDSEA